MKEPYRVSRSLVRSNDVMYPFRAGERLAGHAPKALETLGNPLLLERPKLALFCSVRCPPAKAAAIGPSLKRLHDPGLAVISGFHSPVEKQCLKILLDLQQSVIICLARRLEIQRPSPSRRQLRGARDFSSSIQLSTTLVTKSAYQPFCVRAM